MPVDVRINDVTTEVSVTDGSAILTPQILELIVQAVLSRLEEQKRAERNQARERNLGAARRMETE
jgi:hypothetical protein